MSAIMERPAVRYAVLSIIAVVFAMMLSLSMPSKAEAHWVCTSGYWHWHYGYGYHWHSGYCYWDGRDEALREAIYVAAINDRQNLGNYGQVLYGSYYDPYTFTWRGYFP